MLDSSLFGRRPPNASAAERAYRKPSTTLWLGRIALTTGRFEEALAFYVGTLGLELRTVAPNSSAPNSSAHPYMHALLVDADGQDVLELIEVADGEGGGRPLTQLSFRLPLRTWHLLRVRLLTQEVPYTEVDGALFLEDPDGVMLKMVALDA